MVANLPYSVATPLILRTIAELPSIGRWTVMVQREIAERLRARPGSRSYGSPSVMVQLSCDVRMLRAVDPAVFTPRPRVDSAVLALRRRGTRQISAGVRAADPRLVRPSAEGAAEVDGAGGPAARGRGREAGAAGAAAALGGGPAPAAGRRSRALGLPDGIRAEMLTPEQHLTLAETISRGALVNVEAPAKLNLCLYVGPGARGRPARDLLAVRAARPVRSADGLGERPGRGRRRRRRSARGPT